MKFFNAKPDVIIYSWMFDLALPLEELVIYAYIYDYTYKSRALMFWTSLTVEEIAASLNLSRTVVRNRIEKLLNKDLITSTLKAVDLDE